MKYISTTEELNQFVQTEGDLEFFRIEPYLTRAERELKKIIGTELFEKLQDPENLTAEEKEARNFVCEFISSKGISLSLNTLNVKVGSVGVRRQNTSTSEKAEWYEIKDLNRDLLTMSLESLNDLLVLFDSNSDQFPLWEKSPYRQRHKDLIIQRLDEFEEYFSLNGSYTTFQALKPFLKDAQIKYIQSSLNECFKSTDLTEKLKQNINAALVNYTIAAVCDSGIFKLENNGAIMKIELMPWEKLETVSDVRLERLKLARTELADFYLNSAMDEIVKLPCYVKNEIDGSDILFMDSGLFLP